MNDLATRTSRAAAGPPPPPVRTDPVAIAARIVADNTTNGRRDLGAIKRDIEQVAASDPALGAQVRSAVEARLTPVERGQLASAAYNVTAPDGAAIRFEAGAPSIAQYRAMPPASDGQAFYARLDRIWGDGNAATDDVTRIEAGLAELYRSGTSLADHEARIAAQAQQQAPAPAAGSLATTALDLGQIALDIAGIFEPTPFADGANAIVSAGRGNWLDAGLSVAGILPYVGDLAKLGKLGGWANKIVNAIDLAMSNPAARAALEPGLRRIADALNAIPQGALDTLPDGARDTLVSLKSRLDDFFATAARAFDGRIVAAAERLGIPPARIDEIVSAGRGNRPPVDSYVSPARIAEHARAFENGGSRITLQSRLDTYGPAQRDGTAFITTRDEADAILREAGGDPRKLEAALGLPTGQLNNDSVVRLDFTPEAMKDLNVRMPSGNEAGANDDWLPGGFLASGKNEAVIDGGLARPEHYTRTKVE